MKNLGLVNPGETIYIPFDTFDGGTGASITMTGLAVGDIKIYKDGSMTERASTSGFTLLDTDGIDIDTITGIHGLSIDLSDNTTAGFYEAGSRYFVVIDNVTIDGQTVSFVAAMFKIGYEGAILNTTIASLSSQTGFTLEDGSADNDAYNGCVAVIHDVASAVQIAQGFVSDYVGSTKTITLAADPGIFTMAAGDNISLFPRVDVAAVGGTVQTAGDLMGSIGEENAAAADGDPSTTESLMQYVKQLINILIGTAGIASFPAEAAPANAVSLAEVIRAIHADVTGLNGDAMRGTDSAALASVVGALTDAAADGDPTTADTLMQYVKQLINVLVGTAGVVTFPAAAAPANGVSLAEALRAVYEDTNSLDGTKIPDTLSLANINAEADTALTDYDPPTYDELLAFVQLLARSDAAINTDRSAVLAAINANQGSGVGDYDNQTDSEEALRDHVGDGTNLTEAGGDGDHLTEAGGTGDHLTAVPWNASWDAEVQSEVQDALEANNLDHVVGTATGIPAVPAGTYLDQIMDDGTATFDRTTDSLQAIRDRGDAAWTTGGGGSITDILNLQPIIPVIDLADTATVRLGLMLTNALDDLPSTAEITPGTISIHRKAIGGTSWSAVVTDAACSEQAGLIYYDEVFDSGSGYAEGDSIRVTFKSQKITVAANDYEITDTNGVMFQTYIRETMRGTDGANTQTPLDAAGIRSAVGLAAADLDTQLDAIPTAAENRAEMDANSTQLAAIVGDTNELQTDWADGGRLDNILDARASQVTADAIETDTQDIQARLPAALVGGRMDASIGAVVNDADAAEALLRMFEGAHYGTARSSTTSTTIQLALGGDSTAEYYTGRLIVIASGTGAGQARLISAYTGGVSRIATITPAWAITPNTSSEYVILPAGASIWNADWDAEVQSEAADALTAYDSPTYDELLAFVQLLARSDAAINTDRATELSAINTDEGSGAGDYDNQADAQEAIRDRGDAAWVGAGGGLTQQDIRNAMQLTPTDTTQPDSIDDKLDGLEADIAALSGTELTIVNVIRGNTITQYIADTWEFTLSGLGDISDYNVVAFVVKSSEQQDDDDESLLYVRSDDNLVKIGGANPSNAANGTLTIGSGQISILVAMSETQSLADTLSGNYRWWIKGFDTDPTPNKGVTLATGAFKLRKAGLLSTTP